MRLKLYLRSHGGEYNAQQITTQYLNPHLLTAHAIIIPEYAIENNQRGFLRLVRFRFRVWDFGNDVIMGISRQFGVCFFVHGKMLQVALSIMYNTHG